MNRSVAVEHQWIVAFVILFVLVVGFADEHTSPLGMEAPWPGGITYRCNQGNFGPYSHNNPFDYFAWDFSLPEGALVVAATDGTVSSAGYGAEDGYGIRVRIENRNGSYSLYAHLSDYWVDSGQSIRQGQVIGLSGTTGHTTGPHLHFSIINANHISLPSIFSDIGAPVEGQWCTSRNCARPTTT